MFYYNTQIKAIRQTIFCNLNVYPARINLNFALFKKLTNVNLVTVSNSFFSFSCFFSDVQDCFLRKELPGPQMQSFISFFVFFFILYICVWLFQLVSPIFLQYVLFHYEQGLNLKIFNKLYVGHTPQYSFYSYSFMNVTETR
jgi:hypothetical protein